LLLLLLLLLLMTMMMVVVVIKMVISVYTRDSDRHSVVIFAAEIGRYYILR
jgi:hypothetical protein